MKKSSFVAMVLGTISGVLFALGMCMAMLPQWNAFKPGVVMGCIGMIVALITIGVWRKMEHKEPIKITGKSVLTIALGILGSLTFGVGMCFTMIWSNLIPGIIIGLIGMVLLLCLIPVYKGIQ